MRIIPDDVHVSYAVIDQGQNYSSGNPMYHQDQAIEITDEMLLTFCHGFSQQILCNKLDMNQVLAMTIRNELIEYLKSVIGEEK